MYTTLPQSGALNELELLAECLEALEKTVNLIGSEFDEDEHIPAIIAKVKARERIVRQMIQPEYMLLSPRLTEAEIKPERRRGLPF